MKKPPGLTSKSVPITKLEISLPLALIPGKKILSLISFYLNWNWFQLRWNPVTHAVPPMPACVSSRTLHSHRLLPGQGADLRVALLPSLPTPYLCTSRTPPGRGNPQSGEWSGCKRLTMPGRGPHDRNHPAAGPPLLWPGSLKAWKGILHQDRNTCGSPHLAIIQQIFTGPYSVPVECQGWRYL